MDRKPKEKNAARMGLKSILALICMGMAGCVTLGTATPADRVKGEKFYFDCCNPSLEQGTQEMCDLARGTKKKILVDQDKNQYIFIWSDCTPGEEKWR